MGPVIVYTHFLSKMLVYLLFYNIFKVYVWDLSPIFLEHPLQNNKEKNQNHSGSILISEFFLLLGQLNI